VLNDKLNTRLRGLLMESDKIVDSNADDSRYITKDNMIAYLKEKHKKLGKKTNTLLREHVEFGKERKRACMSVHVDTLSRHASMPTVLLTQVAVSEA